MINLRLKNIALEREYLLEEEKRLLLLQEENQRILSKMKQILKELKGIENELFYEICLNGLNVTKAIDKIAMRYGKDVSTIWKKYYPFVKKQIRTLQNSSEIPVG